MTRMVQKNFLGALVADNVPAMPESIFSPQSCLFFAEISQFHFCSVGEKFVSPSSLKHLNTF